MTLYPVGIPEAFPIANETEGSKRIHSIRDKKLYCYPRYW